jgi:hypothetical protein
MGRRKRMRKRRNRRWTVKLVGPVSLSGVVGDGFYYLAGGGARAYTAVATMS